jgi:hypothetical protein
MIQYDNKARYSFTTCKYFYKLSVYNPTHALCDVPYITLHYTALHYITLHYTTLHCTTLHYTTLYNTTLHYTTLHYTTLPYTALHCTKPPGIIHCAWRIWTRSFQIIWNHDRCLYTSSTHIKTTKNWQL